MKCASLLWWLILLHQNKNALVVDLQTDICNMVEMLVALRNSNHNNIHSFFSVPEDTMGISNYRCPVCNKEPWRLENEHSCYSITWFKEVIWSILKKYVLVIQCLMLSWLHAVFPGVLNWSILSAAWFIFAVTAVIYTIPHQYRELMSKIYQIAERHNLPKNVRCIIF